MEAASDLGGTEGDKKLLSRREPKHQLSLVHHSTSAAGCRKNHQGWHHDFVEDPEFYRALPGGVDCPAVPPCCRCTGNFYVGASSPGAALGLAQLQHSAVITCTFTSPLTKQWSAQGCLKTPSDPKSTRSGVCFPKWSAFTALNQFP